METRTVFTAIRPIVRRTEVIDMLEKLLKLNQRDERSAYRLFLLSTDQFQKELSIKQWQMQVHHVAELQATLKRYGGVVHDASEVDVLQSPTGISWLEFHCHVKQCLDEGGQTLQAYEEMLHRDWPIDIRMLLQRHLIQCKDKQRRLEDSFLPLSCSA